MVSFSVIKLTDVTIQKFNLCKSGKVEQIFPAMPKLSENNFVKFLTNLFEKLHPPLQRQGILVWNGLNKRT